MAVTDFKISLNEFQDQIPFIIENLEDDPTCIDILICFSQCLALYLASNAREPSSICDETAVVDSPPTQEPHATALSKQVPDIQHIEQYGQYFEPIPPQHYIQADIHVPNQTGLVRRQSIAREPITADALVRHQSIASDPTTVDVVPVQPPSQKLDEKRIFIGDDCIKKTLKHFETWLEDPGLFFHGSLEPDEPFSAEFLEEAESLFFQQSAEFLEAPESLFFQQATEFPEESESLFSQQSTELLEESESEPEPEPEYNTPKSDNEQHIDIYFTLSNSLTTDGRACVSKLAIDAINTVKNIGTLTRRRHVRAITLYLLYYQVTGTKSVTENCAKAICTHIGLPSDHLESFMEVLSNGYYILAFARTKAKDLGLNMTLILSIFLFDEIPTN